MIIFHLPRGNAASVSNAFEAEVAAAQYEAS
jgi:hypothetical protein